MKFEWNEKDFPLTRENCQWNDQHGYFVIHRDEMKTLVEDRYHAVIVEMILDVEDITLRAVVVSTCSFSCTGDEDEETYIGDCVSLTEADIDVLRPWLTF